MKTCPRTGKIQYKDRIAAMLALAEIQRQDRPGRHEKDVYKCRFCKKYHLTSMEQA